MFSQSEGLEGDSSTETQYTYYPASIADATTGTMVTTVQASDTLLGQTTPTGQCCPYPLHRELFVAVHTQWLCRIQNTYSKSIYCIYVFFLSYIDLYFCFTGQLYVMMSPQEVLTSNQRTIAPRTQPYIA